MSAGALFALHGFAGAPALWELVPGMGGSSAARPFLPGHGDAPLEEGESFEDALDRLALLAERATKPPRRLLGYSMGARVGLGLLVRHPQIFRDAILVGVNPGLDAADRVSRRRDDEAWAGLLREGGLEPFYQRWDEVPVLQPATPLAGQALRVRAASREGHRAEGLARAMVQLGLGAMPDYRPRLAEIQQPVTLVVGSEDTKFLALAREMVSSMARARLVVVPGAGHNVVLEQPEALSELLGAERDR